MVDEMNKSPEQIWVQWPHINGAGLAFTCQARPPALRKGYIRADLHAARIAELEAEIARLRAKRDALDAALPHEYTMSTEAQRVLDAARTAPQWDTAQDRLAPSVSAAARVAELEAELETLTANKNAAHHWRRENLARAEAAEAREAKLREALVEQNDLLRSAMQIAKREGVAGEIGSTNWDAYYNRVAVVLKRHHDLTNSARAALTQEPKT